MHTCRPPQDKESCHYVTVNTHRGLFECRHLPTRDEKSSEGDQRHLTLYRRRPHHAGTTEEEHLRNLAHVLQRLESAGMRLKDKCAFLLPSVTYLSHIISQEGLHTEETKVRVIVDAQELKNVGELRSFPRHGELL